MPSDTRTALTIHEVTAADEAAVEEAYQIRKITRAYEIPDFPPVCRRQHYGYFERSWPGTKSRFFLARSGGRAVGFLEVNLPQLDNLDNVMVEIYVPPAERRRGVGRALFEHAVALTREIGRKRIMSDTVTPVDGGPERDPAGTEFAAAMGMSEALRDVRRRLVAGTVGDDELDRLLADAYAKADGYSLVTWTDSAPDEYLDDIAILDGRLIQDAPMGDLKYEPMKVDADRIRAADEARAAWGSRQVNAAMRHDGSGHLVAWSGLHQQFSVHDHAWQGITIVHPAHRGHRLGTIVKIENYRQAQRVLPGLRNIDTWNAAVNDFMISINEAMGFRAVDGGISWQMDV